MKKFTWRLWRLDFPPPFPLPLLLLFPSLPFSLPPPLPNFIRFLISDFNLSFVKFNVVISTNFILLFFSGSYVPPPFVPLSPLTPPFSPLLPLSHICTWSIILDLFSQVENVFYAIVKNRGREEGRGGEKNFLCFFTSLSLRRPFSTIFFLVRLSKSIFFRKIYFNNKKNRSMMMTTGIIK